MDSIESIGSRKIGKSLIHPLGVEQVSEILIGIQQYKLLTIFFNESVGDPIGDMSPGWRNKQLKGNSKEYSIYTTLIDMNYNGIRDKWTLHMQPVLKELGQKTKTFLTEIGLIEVRNWLNESRTETWHEGYRHFVVGINENLSEYCVFETQGERVVSKQRFKNNS